MVHMSVCVSVCVSSRKKRDLSESIINLVEGLMTYKTECLFLSPFFPFTNINFVRHIFLSLLLGAASLNFICSSPESSNISITLNLPVISNFLSNAYQVIWLVKFFHVQPHPHQYRGKI